MNMLTDSTFHTIDLFSGAGGMSEGFRMAGFKPLFANDFEAQAIKTYRSNHLDTLCSADPIESIDASELRAELGLERGELDALIGGPPCQGFSTYGKRDPDDKRNQLYLEFIRFVDEFLPTTFVIENVIGILSMQGGAIVDDIIRHTRKLGYEVEKGILDAASYGVPQSRKRVFILGSRFGKPILPTPTYRLPSNTKSKDGEVWAEGRELPTAVTTREAISDLPDDALVPKDTHKYVKYKTEPQSEYQAWARGSCDEVSHHSAKRSLGIRKLRMALMRPGDYGTRIRHRLQIDGLPLQVVNELLGGDKMRNLSEVRREDRLKEEKLRSLLLKGRIDIDEVLKSLDSRGFANKYRRLKWDEPSHTLVAHMARDCSDFVHPDVDRFISVREAARLQSFPDAYFFEGSQFRQFRHIGNAVPPLLAQAVAQSLRAHLNEAYENLDSRKVTSASTS